MDSDDVAVSDSGYRCPACGQGMLRVITRNMNPRFYHCTECRTGFGAADTLEDDPDHADFTYLVDLARRLSDGATFPLQTMRLPRL